MTHETNLHGEAAAILDRLGVPRGRLEGGGLRVRSPITGEVVADVVEDASVSVGAAVGRAHAAFQAWRRVPAPRRGELVRLWGEDLRRVKADLGRLVTIEVGKIVSEGLGEVQEMIDICDFALGLSRQLGGAAIASERPDHRMMEQWHPAGVVAVISAFNFPVAVLSWNAAIALVCGDPVVWKPSEKAPLCALAVEASLGRAIAAFGDAPPDLFTTLVGAAPLGRTLVDDPRVAVVSATGSTRMGRAVAQATAGRFAKTILELGGNNASIVCPTADLDLATRAIAFAAMGTAGQRCTSLRRLIVLEPAYDALLPKLRRAYASVPVGDPREEGVLIGPLIDGAAREAMAAALDVATRDGGTVTGGETRKVGAGGAYVRPALVEMPRQTQIVRTETFAPILYVLRAPDLEAAIALQNDVPQGLSSSIFSNDLREVEAFLAAAGSDCGIANVNMGPSGAEIGGAFGGEKETGGGRESGSDAWKGYMRRMTSAINYGRALPLAQGVRFDVEA